MNWILVVLGPRLCNMPWKEKEISPKDSACRLTEVLPFNGPAQWLRISNTPLTQGSVIQSYEPNATESDALLFCARAMVQPSVRHAELSGNKLCSII